MLFNQLSHFEGQFAIFCGEADVNFQMRCAKVVFNDIGFDGLIPGVAIGLCLREFRELFGKGINSDEPYAVPFSPIEDKFELVPGNFVEAYFELAQGTAGIGALE